MKKNRLGITGGEWIVDYGCTRGHIKAVFENINSYTPTVAVYNWRSKLRGTNATDEESCNAKLIANAGTTANKCGLLSSELLEQRDELLERLNELWSHVTLNNYGANKGNYDAKSLFGKVARTINQIEQQTKTNE